ncbi:hypothetical protein MG290_03275 [Flavobacterium sp. CBA20B-1]|uniref:hypothetical protein n=1 Tax=unclassified Flavobacterium TaxID=196869 RepID=UPI0022240AD4|nr:MULTISPECIES: hypothetical protein [unclassified Flavobacterium]WCM42714.1 hypothetical protein MG290_03275 [Flavobacterium sp. CBA20B-1]
MKKLLLFAAIAVFASCSSDDNNQKDPINDSQSEPILKIAKQTSIYNGDLYYYYGENGYVSEIRSVQQGSDILTKYNYNGNKIINKRYYKDGQANGGMDFFYNSAGLISETVTIGINPIVKVRYEYDSNKVLIKSENYSNDVLSFSTQYQHIGNNCTRKDVTMSDGTIVTNIYKFDLNSVQTTKYSETPEIKKIFTWGDNVVIEDTGLKFDIEFNAKKYPVKLAIDGEVIGTFSYH